MNYKLHYMRLCLRAQGRETKQGEYYETHHIIPRSLGGTDAAQNLVRLTVREHWLAHCLLVRMHPDKPNLVLALEAMATLSTLHKARRVLRLKRWQRRLIAFRKAALLREANKRKPVSPLVAIAVQRYEQQLATLFEEYGI